MDYSIVIPVFNKAGLTRNCLRTLPPTLDGAGEGEVIVIDNASTDETPEMLAEFPWVKAVRNEQNLGFAGANNQGARLASGKVLVLLNNDTQAFPGWLAAMLAALKDPSVGAVGARLLFANDTIQHAGVVIAGVLFGDTALAPFHYAWQSNPQLADVAARRDYQVVTGACLATPRELYLALGGLDETYWNGYEDVDYCLKVRERKLRIVYEPAATLYHFESQSGIQRFRKVLWNVRQLADRWVGKVALDSTRRYIDAGVLPVLRRDAQSALSTVLSRLPETTVIVHGDGGEATTDESIRRNRCPVDRIVRCSAQDAFDALNDATNVRGERCVALVRAGVRLEPGWLDELIAQSAAPPNVAATTYAPELEPGENVVTLAADARCTLLNLKLFPQHVKPRRFDTLDGTVGDLLLRMLEFDRGTRAAGFALAAGVPPVEPDPAFEAVHGRSVASLLDTDVRSIERIVRARTKPARGLVSIVTLSWNAPAFTQKALESIARYTSEPYEVIVVDNGSGPETLAMLGAITDPHVRVLYNPTNRGYAGGNNDGIAAARGEYVVVLNNDVIVTEGWLDGLLDPFVRNRAIGVTAPRSNRVVGHQQLPNATYDGEEGLQAFAAVRREAFERSGYYADRAIGLCLCVSRTVLDQIGGFDERYVLGNFEDDDFCIRVRGAGYSIYVCEDVFIHHFGSQSFAANKVDYTATMGENWKRFAKKWGYPEVFPENGYQPQQAFSRGFDPAQHHVALARPSTDGVPSGVRFVIHARVREESDWAPIAEFVSRFARAFARDERALLAIASFGGPDASALGARVEKIYRKAGVDPAGGGHVELSDEDDEAAWLARFASLPAIALDALDDRSPSALRRLAESRA